MRDYAACAEGFGADAVRPSRAGQETLAEAKGASRRLACGLGSITSTCLATEPKKREYLRIREQHPDENDKSNKSEGTNRTGRRAAAMPHGRDGQCDTAA